MDKNQVWASTLQNISQKVSKMEFHTWFKKVHLKEISGAAVLFACPTEMNKNWMETKYQSTILINIQKVLPEIEKIFFEVDLILSSSPEQVPEMFLKKQTAPRNYQIVQKLDMPLVLNLEWFNHNLL